MDPQLEELQTELGAAHENFIRIAQSLAPEQRNQTGVCGDWSPKDVIAHLIGWDEAVQAYIEDPENFDPPYDVHAHNAKSVAARNELSWQEVVTDLATGFLSLQRAVATVTPKMTIYERVVEWLPGRRADYEVHAGQLAVWLERESRRYWDGAAATFDDEPDHGLRNPLVRRAWFNLLAAWLPTTPASILDIGCGTGSLSVLMAEQGHYVKGIDLSPAMVERAQVKMREAGHPGTFEVMEASHLRFAPEQFDTILCRHLLWTFPEPAVVLQRWVRLIKPGGRLILVEGFWHTGGGLHAQEVIDSLPATLTDVGMQDLSDRPDLWGGPVVDERFLVTATAI